MNIIDEGNGQVTLEAVTEQESTFMQSTLIRILNARGVKFHQRRGGDFITFLPADMQDNEDVDFSWEHAKFKAWQKDGFACHDCKRTLPSPGDCPACGNPVAKINRCDFV